MGNNFGNLITRFTRRNRPTRTTPTRYNRNQYKFNSKDDTLDSIQTELKDRNAELEASQQDVATCQTALDASQQEVATCQTALDASQQKLALADDFHEADTIEQFLKKNEIAKLNNLSKAYNDFRSNEFSRLKQLSTQHRKAMEAGKRRTRRKKRNRLSI